MNKKQQNSKTLSKSQKSESIDSNNKHIIQKKISKKQNKQANNKNKKLQNKQQFAEHEYEEIQDLSPEEMIQQQGQYLEYIEDVQRQSRNEQIQIIPVEEVEENAISYNFVPLYLVKHDQDIHLVYDWNTCQSDIKCFPQEDQDYYRKCFEEGQMLEPKRKIYVTDMQIEFTKQGLQSVLTDGIVNQLRQKYIQGEIVLENMTDYQKTIFESFVVHPPQYTLILFNQDQQLVLSDFKEQHLLPISTKISKRPDKANGDKKCSLWLNFNLVTEYITFDQYFTQKNFQTNNGQGLNKTKEILEILRSLYQLEIQKAEKNKMKPQEDLEIPSEKIVIEKESEEQEEEKQIDTKLQNSLGSEYYKQNKDSEMLDVQLTQDIFQENLDSFATIALPHSHAPFQSCFSQEPESVTVNEILQQGQVSPVSTSVITQAENNGEKYISDQIANFTLVMEKPIKQTLRLNKLTYSISDLKKEFEDFNKTISDRKANNQKNDMMIKEFLLKFPSKSIINTLKKICSDNNIDQNKLIL